MPERQRFVIVLESDGDPHAGRFLARLLKHCWRTFRLKAIDYREVTGGSAAAAAHSWRREGPSEQPGIDHQIDNPETGLRK